jgi:LysR family glycine cleavage system transcriptional activator
MAGYELPPFAALRAFEAYGRLGGVRRAAAALDVSHAAVSRHLRALEALLGVALINRQGGGLTQEGQGYYARIASAIGEISAATSAVRARHSMQLHIWCVPGFAYHWLIQRLSAFRRDHPAVAIDLRPTDNPPNFALNEADGDIRYVRHAANAPHLRSVELARPRVFPVASPAYAASLAGKLQSAADLLQAALIQEDSDAEWRDWFLAQGVAADVIAPAARLWHAHLALAAAREGQGVALGNLYLVDEDLRSGRLVEIKPARGAFAAATLGAYCFQAREDRWGGDGVSAFRRWLGKAVLEGAAAS